MYLHLLPKVCGPTEIAANRDHNLGSEDLPPPLFTPKVSTKISFYVKSTKELNTKNNQALQDTTQTQVHKTTQLKED
eukprot:356400-Amphidinium_carterae.1